MYRIHFKEGITLRKKVTVLGCGLVGSVMALDLAADEAYDVTICDASRENLEKTRAKAKGPVTLRTDVDFASTESIGASVKGQDLVIGAVPGFLGYAMLGAVIRAGVNMSDISFMGEDYSVSHVPDAARAVLNSFDDRASHYEVIDRREQ